MRAGCAPPVSEQQAVPTKGAAKAEAHRLGARQRRQKRTRAKIQRRKKAAAGRSASQMWRRLSRRHVAASRTPENEVRRQCRVRRNRFERGNSPNATPTASPPQIYPPIPHTKHLAERAPLAPDVSTKALVRARHGNARRLDTDPASTVPPPTQVALGEAPAKSRCI